jgi:hypothetical protein
MDEQVESPKLSKLKELLHTRDKVDAAMIAERYEEVPDEPIEERTKRIFNDPSAWSRM